MGLGAYAAALALLTLTAVARHQAPAEPRLAGTAIVVQSGPQLTRAERIKLLKAYPARQQAELNPDNEAFADFHTWLEEQPLIKKGRLRHRCNAWSASGY